MHKNINCNLDQAFTLFSAVILTKIKVFLIVAPTQKLVQAPGATIGGEFGIVKFERMYNDFPLSLVLLFAFFCSFWTPKMEKGIPP